MEAGGIEVKSGVDFAIAFGWFAAILFLGFVLDKVEPRFKNKSVHAPFKGKETAKESCLSQILRDFPPYDPWKMEYPEYKRLKDYCIQVVCFIEYNDFCRLQIFPLNLKSNHFDEFID